MRQYKDNIHFTRYVAAGDIQKIKKELLENIFYLQGDKKELLAAASYAEDNSGFTFAVHEDFPIDQDVSVQSLFAKEKINMDRNFSKERFSKLIELYKQAFPDYLEGSGSKEIISGNEVPSQVKLGNPKKILLIAGSLVLAGYVINKCTSDNNKAQYEQSREDGSTAAER